MKSNIALIGFMGSGKTAVGKILAASLRKRYIEIDATIEQKAGKPIPELFREEGETAFREREIAAVKQTASGRDQVIDCGGGVILNGINVDRLKITSVMVYLTATPTVILARTSGNADRPLLEIPDKLTRIKELLSHRGPLYEKAADITVDTSGQNADSAAAEIVRKLREYERNNC